MSNLVSMLSGCVCVSGVETSFDSIRRKNLPTRERLFSSRASRIVLEPNQISWPNQNVRNVYKGKVELLLKVMTLCVELSYSSVRFCLLIRSFSIRKFLQCPRGSCHVFSLRVFPVLNSIA